MLVCSALSQLLQRVAAQLCFWGSLAAFFGLLSSSSPLPLPSPSPHPPLSLSRVFISLAYQHLAWDPTRAHRNLNIHRAARIVAMMMMVIISNQVALRV